MPELLHRLATLLHSDLAVLVEEVLVLAAIVLAVLHERALKRQLDHIRQIRDELPTRHVGRFPKYLDEIVRLVQSARKRIVICCDFPAYGGFSDAAAFLNYRQELERKITAGIPTTIVCLDPQQRVLGTREQFAMPTEEWDKWKSANHLKIDDYLARHSPGVDRASLVLDAFVAMISAEDNRVLDVTFEAATKVVLHKRPPVYFWLIDNSMVFAIPGVHHLPEHGFSTRDSSFIQGLCEIVESETSLKIDAMSP